MAATSKYRSYTFDAGMQLKDAGLVAASAAAQVSSSNQIIDLGGADPFFGIAVIDVTALETDSSNELYRIQIQGSNSSTFAGSAAAVLGEIELGHATGLAAGLATTTTGRFEVPFLNVQNDTAYRYLRAYTVISGTIATGINWKGFVGRVPMGF